jgi:methanogenic corrinoid protein MtbC1
MNDRPSVPPAGITIGAMSRATGIPANTLRTWERRYGFPQPQRSEGGQRLYDAGLIGHLRLVNQALEAGHRPMQVLSLDRAALSAMLGTGDSPVVNESGDPISAWMHAVRQLDERRLESLFRSESSRLGLLRFLTERVAPFLTAMGEGWRAGAVQVYQEHWASEKLKSFLLESWKPLARTAPGAPIVLTTLPGDKHDLGLHMTALVVAMCGWQVVFLGRDTPIQDVADATDTRQASAVLVSVSAWTDRDMAASNLLALRKLLDDDVEIVVGGAGAPQVPGITTLGGLEALYAWAAGEG